MLVWLNNLNVSDTDISGNFIVLMTRLTWGTTHSVFMFYWGSCCDVLKKSH